MLLGDKSNHVATIHLPQMLYIWPFIALFSLPLLYYNVPDLLYLLWPLKWWSANFPGAGRRPQLSTGIWLFLGTLMALGVIHFNTIIHPFTLADNRHYVFYVFRYTIRRHFAVRYQLAPVYITCAFFAFRTLAGYNLLRLNATISRGKDGGNITFKSEQSPMSDSLSRSSLPSTSFTMVWLISTALSLITAPLVEPRYFIIPWVIWRLHVPTLPLASDIERPAKDSNAERKRKPHTSKSCWAGWMKYWAYEGHDHRLWLETIWFLLISLITGSIFLFKGFEWPQEPGKVQRFMW
jgi:alpha-1,2-glucosyltransferase